MTAKYVLKGKPKSFDNEQEIKLKLPKSVKIVSTNPLDLTEITYAVSKKKGTITVEEMEDNSAQRIFIELSDGSNMTIEIVNPFHEASC